MKIRLSVDKLWVNYALMVIGAALQFKFPGNSWLIIFVSSILFSITIKK